MMTAQRKNNRDVNIMINQQCKGQNAKQKYKKADNSTIQELQIYRYNQKINKTHREEYTFSFLTSLQPSTGPVLAKTS